MQREIKFRGKRVDNGDWEYGDLVHSNFFIWIISFDSNDWYEVIPETVGQFTGLYDKNEKEIFEGDVVKYIQYWNEYEPSECIYVETVEFINGSFSPINHHVECDDGWYSHGIKDIEILGNIHEHSHLLEVK